MAARRMPLWQSVPLWAALNLAGLAAAALPRPVELALGALLGRAALRVDRRRRRVAEENIRHCLPGLSAAERDDLLRRNFEHYGRLVLELLHIFCPLPGHWQRWTARHTKLVAREKWAAALAGGKGVIYFSAHVGNWEMAIAVGGLKGFPAVMVTRRLTPDWLMRRMEATRLSTRLGAAYQPRTMPILLKTLKSGGSVGFMADQYIPPPGGATAPLFGVPVHTLAMLGPLAHRTGAVLAPLYTHRDEDGAVVLEIGDPLERGDWMADPAESAKRVNAALEVMIRRHPEQWLWGHRRFKNAVWPDGSAAYSDV